MTLIDCISRIRQYGVIQRNFFIDVFEENISRFILENDGKSIWLTESSFEIKIEVHLGTQGDVNICILSKIDDKIKEVAFTNNDHRVYKTITVQHFIDSMNLSELDLRQTVLKKIFNSFFHCLNNLIPEQFVYGTYFYGNPYYFPDLTDKERSAFDNQTINYRKCKYEWEITRLKYQLKNKKEFLRFLPTLDELKKTEIESLYKIKEAIEDLNQYKFYLKQLEENMKVGMIFTVENDLLSIQFVEK